MVANGDGDLIDTNWSVVPSSYVIYPSARRARNFVKYLLATHDRRLDGWMDGQDLGFGGREEKIADISSKH